MTGPDPDYVEMLQAEAEYWRQLAETRGIALAQVERVNQTVIRNIPRFRQTRIVDGLNHEAAAIDANAIVRLAAGCL